MDTIFYFRPRFLFMVVFIITIVGHWLYILGYIKKSSHKLGETEIVRNIQTLSFIGQNTQSETHALRQAQEIDENIRFEPFLEISWKPTLTEPNFEPTTTALRNEPIKKKHYDRVAFLKTHKAGSSTAQNIFLRYGESRNLTFLLARHRKGQYDNVIALQTSLNENNTLDPPPNKTFDIVCCHVLYNRKAFQKYMPNDTAYIGILREPFEQFLSTLNYFGSYRIFKNKTKSGYKVLEYLNNPWAYEQGIKPYWSFTNNRMAVEFDFPSSLFNKYSKEESTAYLEKLDSEFHLVIILEYFMESVVLMRRILGWTIKDILYLKKNVARRDYSFVDNTHRHLYEKFAKLDYDLYNFFHMRLWEKIQEEGEDFQLELLYFRRLRSEIEDYCMYSSSRYNSYSVQASKWSDSFNVTRLDCKLLRMHEMGFVSHIRKRQYG